MLARVQVSTSVDPVMWHEADANAICQRRPQPVLGLVRPLFNISLAARDSPTLKMPPTSAAEAILAAATTAVPVSPIRVQRRWKPNMHQHGCRKGKENTHSP